MPTTPYGDPTWAGYVQRLGQVAKIYQARDEAAHFWIAAGGPNRGRPVGYDYDAPIYSIKIVSADAPSGESLANFFETIWRAGHWETRPVNTKTLGNLVVGMAPGHRAELGSIRDVPLPPNVPRPEMWTPEAVVQAVKDGFTFGIPFIGSGFTQNAYWIKGEQYGANMITVGPDHSQDIRLVEVPGAERPWIGFKAWFQPYMVKEEAWLEPPNENGVVPVWLEIDPETIDWDNLNRGYQIQTRREF